MSKINFMVIVMSSLLSFFFVGCFTFVYEQPIHTVDLPKITDTEKVPLNIELSLTDEFRNANWEKHEMGDKYILPLGDNLVYHTEKLMNSVFKKVVVNEKIAEHETYNNPIYIMTPTVLAIDQSRGLTIYSEAKTSITIEWKLTNRSGEILWIETTTGTGVGELGSFTGSGKQKTNERVNKALNELFPKAQEEMLTSEVLRSLP